MALFGVNHQGISRAPLVKASLIIRIVCVLLWIDDNVLKDFVEEQRMSVYNEMGKLPS